MRSSGRPAQGFAICLVLALAGCSNASWSTKASRPGSSATAVQSASPAASATASPEPLPMNGRRGIYTVPSKRPRATRITMSIPSIGLVDRRVVAYEGQADDLPGTRIQDRGFAATPTGERGGVGPGEIGNFIVTGHRTEHGAPFRRLPSMREGQHILISAGGQVYDYVVTDTMTISFRSARDLARQSAPVPGHPGREPTEARITLSTCATPEDNARGNFWRDELGNPEHRINKIGVLVAVRSA